MISDSRRLLSNLFSLAAVRGLEFLIPLITLPYLVRVLGLDKFGLINFSIAFATYFAAAIQYGFTITAVRKIARYRDNVGIVSTVYSQTTTASLILVTICGCAHLIILLSIEELHNEFALHAFTFWFVAMQSLFPVWFFQGMENMKQSVFISLAARLLQLLGILTLVKAPSDYLFVPAIGALTMLTSWLFSLVWIKKYYKIPLRLAPPLEALATLREGRHAFISQLSPTLYINSSTFLLGWFVPPASVGAFAAASKVIDMFNALGIIFSNAFYPFLARRPSFLPLFHRAMVATGFFLTLVSIYFSEIIAQTLFSDQNLVVSEYIEYLAVGVFAFFIMRAYGDNGLMLIGKDRVAGRIALYLSTLFLLIGIITIPWFGVYGAIIMLVGARCTMAAGWKLAYARSVKNLSHL